MKAMTRRKLQCFLLGQYWEYNFSKREYVFYKCNKQEKKEIS